MKTYTAKIYTVAVIESAIFMTPSGSLNGHAQSSAVLNHDFCLLCKLALALALNSHGFLHIWRTHGFIKVFEVWFTDKSHRNSKL